MNQAQQQKNDDLFKAFLVHLLTIPSPLRAHCCSTAMEALMQVLATDADAYVRVITSGGGDDRPKPPRTVRWPPR